MLLACQQAIEYLMQNQDRFVSALAKHMQLDAICLIMCILIAVPLGYISAKNEKFGLAMMNLTNLIRIVPTIAIFIMLIPITGIGTVPAAIALTGMSIPTILINTMSGIKEIEPRVIECAEGMGMGWRDICFGIELPLASPMILNGIRTATIEIVASTTIASYIGAGGLGNFIISGLSQNRTYITLVGAVPVAVIAIVLDFLLSKLQKMALERTV